MTPPKRVALLVGVDTYRARHPWSTSRCGTPRATRSSWPRHCRQKFDLVKTLIGDDATLKGIDAALAKSSTAARQRPRADRVQRPRAQLPLVDDAGKPVFDDRDRPLSEAYFCPADAVLGHPETMVSLTRLMERLNREGGVNLMLVDACRDDPEQANKKGFRTLSGNEMVGRLPNDSVILFSVSAGQRAGDGQGRRRPRRVLSFRDRGA